jgi:hypothetical protein
LGTDYLAGIFRSPDDLASQVAAAVSAQGLTRHMVDRVLGKTSVAGPEMEPFAKGSHVNDSTLLSIKQMIQNSGSVRALVLTIGEGQWWSTRLFLLASLLRSLTPIAQLMGLGREAEGALTSPDYRLEEIRQIGTDRTCTLVKTGLNGFTSSIVWRYRQGED